MQFCYEALHELSGAFESFKNKILLINQNIFVHVTLNDKTLVCDEQTTVGDKQRRR